MTQENSIINIALITDEGYAMPTGVAIFSLKQNRDPTSRYHIYVLCNAVCSQTYKRYRSMIEEGFEITLIDVTKDAERYKDAALRDMHVTATAMFKFDLPKYFPQLDKILYVDGDVLIQHDLREIYETDISDVYLAVVEDMKAMTRYQPPILIQLRLNHKHYFHTGMMVMNLAKLRQDDIPAKLLNYRIHGINYFMDQDAFNAVTDEKVIYLSPLTNYCFTLDIEFTNEEILSYYGIENEPRDTAERQRKAIVFHLPGAYKPWRFQMWDLTTLYIGYYSTSPFGVDNLILKQLPKSKDTEKLENLLDSSKKARKMVAPKTLKQLLGGDWMGVNQQETRSPKVTLSMTSFPARIDKVPTTLVQLMQQTYLPDRIVLCLSPDEFPNRESDLPNQLLSLREHGLEILWGENLRPHTKYQHTAVRYPNDIIITVDDDIWYPTNLVETLMRCHQCHPNAVAAMRAHLMTFDDSGSLLPYRSWHYQCSAYVDRPLMSLFATGVGGVLYPPHLMTFADTLDVSKIKNLCLNNDDIWLKFMQVLSGVPVVLACACYDLDVIEGTQKVALSLTNVRSGENDKLMNLMLERYNTYYGADDSLVSRMFRDRRRYMKPTVLPSTDKVSFKNLFRMPLKSVFKSIFPIPVKGFMREISIVKGLQEDTLTYIGTITNDLNERFDRQQAAIEQLNHQLDNALTELKALREYKQ